MERRGFLRTLTGVGVAGMAGVATSPRVRGRTATGQGPLPSPGAPGVGEAPLDRWGVQLYTVRDAMAENVPGTLARVSEMGYREVEFAGLFGRSAPEMRAILDGVGLRAASSHVGMDVIRGSWGAALDDAATLGQDLVVLPSLPGDARTADGLRALAEELNGAGEEARRRGLHLGFHNHGFEVTPLDPSSGGDGTPASRPLDILLAHTEPELVSFQLDLFWTVDGGADPVAYFRDHPGRFLSVHVKDRTRDGRMVEVGAGVMDFSTLLRVGQEVGGVRHGFVEHDRPEDSLASIRASIDYLRTLGG